jgi:alpha-2-macroglobulin
MKKSILLLLATMVVLFSYCTRDSGKKGDSSPATPTITYTELPPDPGFGEFIASYTSGVMPANGNIEIRLTPEFAAKASKEKPGSLFTFEPSIKGSSEWADDYTIIYKPSKALNPGTIYRGSLNLSRLGSVPERLRSFPFRFQTVKRDFKVELSGLTSDLPDGKSYTFSGDIVTSDFMTGKEVEGLLTAKTGRRSSSVQWEHPAGGNTHHFTIKGIEREKEPQVLTISWDGSKAGIKGKGSQEISIPALADFSVWNVTFSTGDNQRINIEFTDPLDPQQEIEGLIYLTSRTTLTFERTGNRVTLFPAEKLKGDVTISIDNTVRNSSGRTLGDNFVKVMNFTTTPPGIKAVGQGVIVPASTGTIFPFRAANLSSVDLSIIKIFSNNIPYFLQMNNLSEAAYIRQYGRPVYRGRIDLINDKTIDPNTWNLFSIDISDYIVVEPGVIYRVEIGMRPSYSLYPCAETRKPGKYEEMLDRLYDSGDTSWDNPTDYWDEGSESGLFYQYAYNWRENSNPCSDAYYSPDKKLSRNLLATNLGLIAKRGSDNVLHVIVSDIATAEPLTDVKIDVYDMQLQLIGSASSDKDGFASLASERKPFLLIASTVTDRNYLKLNDGAALSVSSFDVSGSTPEKGLKAFIYGERDVWRPGDTIFLSVFVKEMNLDIPQDHPVQFELFNPAEQRVDFQVQSVGGRNLLTFVTRTPSDAPTGNYRAVIRIGGATFTHRLRIETVKPNRLKIDLKFDEEILGGDKQSNKATLNARWLSGAVSGNLKSNVELLLKPVKTTFDKYSQYIFDNPVADFYSETQTVFDGQIDDKGDATFNVSPGKGLRPAGMLMAQFTTRVFEKGGDASITQTGVKYAAYPVFVGINFPGLKGTSRMLFTDADNDIRVVTVDATGKPVRSDVEITIYKLSYRWWWESGDEQLGYYVSNNYYKPVFKQKINTSSSGEGGLQFNIPKAEWGRYLIRASVPTGHSTGKIMLVDWPWEYGFKGGGGAATVLALTSNKDKYGTGENIEISFPAPAGAKAIVTIENSTGVIDRFRVNTVSPNTVVNIKAAPGMAPNMYVYVSVIQPHAQTVNDMPVRLYGVMPVMVEDPGTRLEPAIDMAPEIRSGSTFEVKVSEVGRKAMSYTLAVVDEGLLDLTGFKTPNPWNYFYAREALGVRSWDIYDYILGAFGGTLERVFAIGGDEAFMDRSARKANRFVPVVRFIGPVKLEAGKTNTHKITMPRYTGAVRVMVVGGSTRAYGSAEKSVFVRDPLMLLATAPRVLSPGEKVTLPVTVFVQDEKIRNVTITASGNELVRFGESTQQIAVTQQGERDIEFTLTASEKQGRGEIKVIAEGGGERAEYSFEIEIRSPNPPETRSEMRIVKAGEKIDIPFAPFGMEGTNSAKVEVSSLPSVNLEKRLSYLTGYPHGCTEQITSAAFPQLYLKELYAGDAKVVEASAKNVQQAIHQISTRQMTGGGLALWPGSAFQPDMWVTSYAGHFMIEAGRKGYNIPSGFMNRWTTFQRKEAQSWRYDANYKQTATVQAYRLYTLALAGAPERGAMNRLRETKGIPRLAGWMLAGAYAVSGRPEAATELIDVRTLATEEEYMGYYYGGALRDKAVILHTLLLLKNEEQALLLLKELAEEMSRDTWYSTQATAWGLFSYMKFVEAYGGGGNKDSRFSFTLNGNESKENVSAKSVFSKEVVPFGSSNTMQVVNNSDAPLYVNLTIKGTPKAGDATKQEKNLAMKIEYTDLTGKAIDQQMLQQGTDFMMIVRVTNNSYRAVDNIALAQMVPSGWEIRNTRLFEADFGVKESTYDYRDFRDDRLYTYFSIKAGETKTFVALLNAAYRGDYQQPAVWCEAMYDDGFYSRIPGGNVKVVK